MSKLTELPFTHKPVFFFNSYYHKYHHQITKYIQTEYLMSLLAKLRNNTKSSDDIINLSRHKLLDVFWRNFSSFSPN